jgi:hypothetical protein
MKKTSFGLPLFALLLVTLPDGLLSVLLRSILGKNKALLILKGKEESPMR